MLSAILMCAVARAATLTVPGMYGSIQDAVNHAANGDRVEVSAGTWREEVLISGKSISLVGIGGSSVVTIDGDTPLVISGGTSDVSGFTLAAQDRGVLVVLANVAFTDIVASGARFEDDGGGAEIVSSAATFDSCTFDDNDVRPSRGGNLFVSSASAVTLTNCTLTNGRALDGGGIYTDASSILNLIGTTVAANDADGEGGGLYLASTAVVTISATALRQNHADAGGGGIYSAGASIDATGLVLDGNSVDNDANGSAAWLSGSTAFVSSASIVQNHAVPALSGTILLDGTASYDGTGDVFEDNALAFGSGGGLEAREDALVSLSGALFDANSAASGGAIAGNSTQILSIDGSTFTGNSAAEGGAIRWDGPLLSVTGSTFVANAAIGGGGAMVLDGEAIAVTDSIFRDNTADVGGALAIIGPETTLLRNVFGCNHAVFGQGGGVDAEGAAGGDLANNVFAENTATGFGGGLYWFGGADPSIAYHTFAGNSGSEGGGVYIDGAGFTWDSNLVVSQAGNGLSADAAVNGHVFSIEYSLWDANLASNLGGGLSAFLLDNTQVYAPAAIDWSADGDCTNDTWWPILGSPAIDAGDPFVADPDGTRSDIGAFGGPESDPTPWADADGDGSIAMFDCDDLDPTVLPGAAELCDDVDSDCDDDLDDPDALDAQAFFLDSDGDGFGDAAVEWDGCFPPDGYVLDSSDCNDQDATVTGPTVWYPDADGDGWGGAALLGCIAPANAVDQPGDCDDANPGVSPDATEVCNGLDDDCDGAIDVGAADAATSYGDGDGDGYGDAGESSLGCTPRPGDVADATDCDDGNADVHPGAPEVCDGLDDDCDGTIDPDDSTDAITWYPDEDGDGLGDAGGAPVTSCDAPDGYAPAGDCDDASAALTTDCPGDSTADSLALYGGGGGCGCDQSPTPRGALGVLLAVALVFRRRR